MNLKSHALRRAMRRCPLSQDRERALPHDDSGAVRSTPKAVYLRGHPVMDPPPNAVTKFQPFRTAIGFRQAYPMTSHALVRKVESATAAHDSCVAGHHHAFRPRDGFLQRRIMLEPNQNFHRPPSTPPCRQVARASFCTTELSPGCIQQRARPTLGGPSPISTLGTDAGPFPPALTWS